MPETPTKKASAWLDHFLLALVAHPGTLKSSRADWIASDENPKDEKAWRPLLALLNKKEGDPMALARELLACGANPKARDEDGDTALMLAAHLNNVEFVRLLMPLSDLGAKNNKGLTALMHAAGAGSVEALQLLLPRSDPKTASHNGSTALMGAAAAAELECLKILLPVSDVIAVNNKGLDAFGVAMKGVLSVHAFGSKQTDFDPCVEALAPFIGIERLRAALAAIPPESLQAAHTLVERHDLAAVVQKSSKAKATKKTKSETAAKSALAEDVAKPTRVAAKRL